jgi:hypothetical protein
MNRPFGIIALLGVLAVAGLAGCAGMKNPFAEEKPFVPTAVPDDFAIIVEKDFSTYYSRQHMQQVITQQDLTSRAKYWSFRDYNNTVSSSFENNQPLLAEQTQAMWNEVEKNNLLVGGTLWLNSLSEADKYRLNVNTIQIRANGKVKTYSTANGYPTPMRGLIAQVDAIRLKMPGAEVVGKEPATAPATTKMSVEDAVGKPATQGRVVPTMIPGQDLIPVAEPSGTRQ